MPLELGEQHVEAGSAGRYQIRKPIRKAMRKDQRRGFMLAGFATGTDVQQ
jgi:hypothetical protein